MKKKTTTRGKRTNSTKAMGTIYMLRNRRNGKKYIGSTARDLEIRIAEEFSEPYNTCCTRDLCRAIKRDPTAFEVRRLAEVPTHQLRAAEDRFIDLHDTRDNGYNMTGGGGGSRMGGPRDERHVFQHGGGRCGAWDSDTGEACRRKAKVKYDGRCHLH